MGTSPSPGTDKGLSNKSGPGPETFPGSLALKNRYKTGLKASKTESFNLEDHSQVECKLEEEILRNLGVILIFSHDMA